MHSAGEFTLLTAVHPQIPRRLDFKAEGWQGFSAYHDLYAGGSTVSRLGPAFSAAVVAHRFPRLLLFDRRISGAAHDRDQARVRRDGFEHFNVQVLRAGRMDAGPPGDERALFPGDVVLFDTTRPQRTLVKRADYAVVGLPRDVVEAALPDARRLHGAVLPRAAAGLLGDFVLSLVRHAPALRVDLAIQSGDMVAALLAATVGAARTDPPSDGSAIALALHRARADAYINAHLSDPALDPDRIAAELGLSRSTLYRAFAPAGGIARRITARRIGRLHAALSRPGGRHTVASLALEAGFTSESRCRRAFQAAHGVTLGQFRAGMRVDESGKAGGLDGWINELR